MQRIFVKQPDLQPPGGEDIGVEGDLARGAGGFVQHDAGDGEAVPVQEAGLGDLLRPQLRRTPASSAAPIHQRSRCHLVDGRRLA